VIPPPAGVRFDRTSGVTRDGGAWHHRRLRRQRVV